MWQYINDGYWKLVMKVKRILSPSVFLFVKRLSSFVYLMIAFYILPLFAVAVFAGYVAALITVPYANVVDFNLFQLLQPARSVGRLFFITLRFGYILTMHFTTTEIKWDGKKTLSNFLYLMRFRPNSSFNAFSSDDCER